MSPRIIAFSALAIASFAIAAPTPAAVLYDNGADIDFDFGAFSNTSPFQVTDSFALSSSSTLTGVTFANWFVTPNTGSKVDWTITSAPFGGTTLASGVGALSFLSNLGTSGSFSIYSETFSMPSISLSSCTYWLQLNSEVVTGGTGY
jgi:hypothetical protein